MPELDPAYLITDRAALQARYPAPSRRSRDKVRTELDADDRAWLHRCGFVAVASADETGLDVSPRGDAPGRAFEIVDERTLLLPDRRGNHRIDTLTRLVDDPRIALLFLVPGEANVLRVHGRAQVSCDPALLERFALDGERPATVIAVQVERVLMQNTRAVRRAGLWE